MTNELRVVIDTSVAVSAVLFVRSVPRQAFDLAASSGRLIVSEATIAELDAVFRRRKFNQYVSEARRLEFLAAIVREAELVDVRDVVSECRDPKDDKFLELAVSGRATHLISGDADLLAMNPFRGVAILNLLTFVATLTQNP